LIHMSLARDILLKTLLCQLGLSCLGGNVVAEELFFTADPAALPTSAYIHAVDLATAPVEPVWIPSSDGVYVAAAVRKPAGEGPFPVLIMFHGAPGGRGMEQLIGWSRGDHGGPVWERFLQEGYMVIVADYRGGDWNVVNQPGDGSFATAIDDGQAVIRYARSLPEADADNISLYGVSLGGNLVMYLASMDAGLNAVVAGAPFPVWYLGATLGDELATGRMETVAIDSAVAAANIAPLSVPILIQVGTDDPVKPITDKLYAELDRHGKAVRIEVYEHGYHDFVLGPQGQDALRPDLPEGEKLMQITLDALARSLAFIRSGTL